MDSEIKENQREVPKVKYTMNWTHFSGDERKPKGRSKAKKDFSKWRKFLSLNIFNTNG